jgi:hypothetical protein
MVQVTMTKLDTSPAARKSLAAKLGSFDNAVAVLRSVFAVLRSNYTGALHPDLTVERHPGMPETRALDTLIYKAFDAAERHNRTQEQWDAAIAAAMPTPDRVCSLCGCKESDGSECGASERLPPAHLWT